MSERGTQVDLPENDEVWEMRVEELARHLPYPPTPDVAGQVAARLRRSENCFPPILMYVWVY